MKTSKKGIHKQWRLSSHETGPDDEEKLLEVPRQNYPDSIEDQDFDPSLQKIASNWSGSVFSFSDPEDQTLSPTSCGSSSPSSISLAKAQAKAQILTPTPPSTSTSTQNNQAPPFPNRLKKIFTNFPIRDPSWLTACTFTVGSSVFVINGFFLLLPMVQPGWDFEGEGTYAGPATSILGSTIFLIGGWAAMLEALNLRRGGGGVGGGEFEGEDEEVVVDEGVVDEEKGDVYASPRVSEVGYNGAAVEASINERYLMPISAAIRPAMIGSNAFIWCPSISEFRDIYQHDPRFIAAIIQILGASIFSISTIANIPGVVDLTNTLVLDILSLLPTLVGGLCFLMAALIQTGIAQDVWHIPTPWRLRWHVGFWNCVGSMGFALAGGLPFFGEAATFQATLADFWGSWGFMIGSVVQWYVVMGNYP